MLQRFALIFRSELGFKIIYVIPPIANADVATAATILRQNLFLSCIPEEHTPYSALFDNRKFQQFISMIAFPLLPGLLLLLLACYPPYGIDPPLSSKIGHHLLYKRNCHCSLRKGTFKKVCQTEKKVIN